jgi:hypothetical protein
MVGAKKAKKIGRKTKKERKEKTPSRTKAITTISRNRKKTIIVERITSTTKKEVRLPRENEYWSPCCD